MPIITLTTDFGIKDHFVGAIKGTIYSELPDARVVDISHDISPFNLYETAYILKNSYKSFPKGSIHIIGVDSELTPENKHIAIKIDGHYFICADNGLMSLLLSDYTYEKLVEINIHDRVESSFPVLDVFVKVACHLARGGTLEVIGKPFSSTKQLVGLQPTVSADKNTIKGNIIYIDNYGNSISNITKKFFQEIGKGRDFQILGDHYNFKLYQNYSDIVNFELEKDDRHVEGQKLAIFNSADFLEIALYRSNLRKNNGACTLLGLDIGKPITIKFY